MIDLSKLAEAVKSKRSDLSIVLDQVAEQSGVSAATLSRIENQLHTPDLSTYSRVCAWLGVPLDTFIEQVDAMAA